MKVRFREKALDDISLIRSYRSTQHSDEVAERVEDEIFATTDMLGKRVIDGRRVRNLKRVPR